MTSANEPDAQEELESILFGLNRYERQSMGAPEFDLFADLAPALTPDQLMRVLENFYRTGAGIRFERLRTLSGLLAYCPTVGSEALLGELARRALEYKLAIPERLVPTAYQGLISTEPNHSYRAETVVWLSNQLPPEQACRFLFTELESTAQEPDWAYTQYNAIIPLARAVADIPKVYLVYPGLGELSSRLIQVAQTIPIPVQRLEILISILPLLLNNINEGLLEQILGDINGLPSKGERAKLLVWLIESLSSLLSNMTIAKEEILASYSASLIGDHLWQGPENLKADLLKQAFDAARSLDFEDQKRESLLAQLSLEAEEAFSQIILDEALAPYSSSEGGWSSREATLAQTLAGLVSALPTRLHGKLASIIQSRQLPLTGWQTWELFPYASPQQIFDALDSLSQADSYFGERAEMLVRIAHFLPVDQRDIVLRKLLEIEDPVVTYPCLLSLLPALTEIQQPLAIKIAHALGDSWFGWRAWAALLERFPDIEPTLIPEEATKVSARSLQGLWQANHTEIQSEILSRMIRRLWEFYGGSAPPGDGSFIDVDTLDEGSHTSDLLPTMPAEVSPDEQASEPELKPTADAPAEDWSDTDYWPSGEPIAFAETDGAAVEEDKVDDPDQAVVSTGFAPQKSPEQAVKSHSPLLTAGEYYFLFSIGERKKFDIAPNDSPIRAPLDKLPPKASLQVALFAFPGEIEIRPGQDVGELELLPDRSVRVAKPVAEPVGLSDQSLLEQVLFFPVKMPVLPGSYRLRANLYCQGVLVQSYLVQALAVPRLGRLAHRLRIRRPRLALETSLDYTLSNRLNSAVLADLKQHSLSLLINDNGNGTHGMRFFGQTGGELFKGDATFTGQELQNLIEQGRGALRQAAWGEKGEWDSAWDVEEKYKYLKPRPKDWEKDLKPDLVALAKWGWRFYTQVFRHLAEDGAQTEEEAELKREQIKNALATTSLIQIASKESLRHVLPAALIYDYPLHDTLPGSMISLCPEFTAALESGTPLEETPCFNGACPSQGNIQVVCPSGFWGYRHILGLPVSIGADQGNAETKINFQESPILTVSFSTDLDMWAGHLSKIHGLRLPLGWFEADTGQETLEYLRTSNPHIVYFYCHGGLTEDKVPYLQVGPKNDPWGLITPSVLPAMQIRWKQPRPLVFINGCHTTALEPEAALDMVSGFVRDAGAAGVIGTEITVFEPLATAFAEEFLRLFLNGVPIGAAVRSARLNLLQNGNPLGLVYIPFAVASLAMEGNAGLP
jgi:hypothetical protein